MAAEQLDTLFEVLQGGKDVAAGEIVQFPTDVSAATGSLSGEGVSTVVQMGNGAAAEVSQLTTTAAGSTTATTTGVGLLAVDVGVAGAAIAPALGILAGVGLYNLTPEFWTNVSNTLVNAGQTVGGKVRAFLDGNNKKAGFSEETIEIFKNAFLQAGLFETISELDITDVSELNTYFNTPMILSPSTSVLVTGAAYDYKYLTAANPANLKCCVVSHRQNNVTGIDVIFASLSPFLWGSKSTNSETPTPPTPDNSSRQATINGQTFYYEYADFGTISLITDLTFNVPFNQCILDDTSITDLIPLIAYYLLFGNISTDGVVQPDAVIPDTNPFPNTYPGWIPSTVDGIKIYPTEIPVNDPNPDQDAAQDPNPNPDPAPWLEWLINNLPQPQPLPDPQPQPAPEPDPDPQPEADPIPEDDPLPDEPNPPDPNPDPEIPPLPIVPDIPAMVESNAMFTVYNPSLSDLNTFGGWLWSSSIIEQILRLWQNPLDGIIAFMKVYAAPSVTTARTIQIGYLASDATAPVVSSQFVTIDCGTIQVGEKKQNASDYPPYVSLHLYLPFIGIVELDPNDFMDGSINIKYVVDMYTGTCLAEVSAARTADMPNSTILYTFSGNASQQLPLTSASFGGAISSLVSVVGSGIAIASGGAVAGIAGAASLGHSLTHEMIHVGHSGGLSANAGIMTSRKPYLIISRRHGYDANNYAQQYGYPANKTVYLKNCHGYTRVKSCHFKGDATDVEKQEIMNYLSDGVIL